MSTLTEKEETGLTVPQGNEESISEVQIITGIISWHYHKQFKSMETHNISPMAKIVYELLLEISLPDKIQRLSQRLLQGRRGGKKRRRKEGRKVKEREKRRKKEGGKEKEK